MPKVLIKKAFSNAQQTLIVDEFSEDAAVLVGTKGQRFSDEEASRYENCDEHFVDVADWVDEPAKSSPAVVNSTSSVGPAPAKNEPSEASSDQAQDEGKPLVTIKKIDEPVKPAGKKK